MFIVVLLMNGELLCVCCVSIPVCFLFVVDYTFR